MNNDRPGNMLNDGGMKIDLPQQNQTESALFEFGVSNDGRQVVIHLGNIGRVGLPSWDAIELAARRM